MRNKTTYNVWIESRPIKLAFKGPENGDVLMQVYMYQTLHMPVTQACVSCVELFQIGKIGATPLRNFKLAKKNIGQQFRKYFFTILRFHKTSSYSNYAKMLSQISINITWENIKCIQLCIQIIWKLHTDKIAPSNTA